MWIAVSRAACKASGTPILTRCTNTFFGHTRVSGLGCVSGWKHSSQCTQGRRKRAWRPLRSEYVSGNYFSMFGLQTRCRTPDCSLRRPTQRSTGGGDEPPRLANYFASDPSIVGTTFKLDGVPFTVIGIGPAGFYRRSLEREPSRLWLPLATEPLVAGPTTMLKAPDLHWLYVMGRLQPEASSQSVQQKVTIELQQWLNSGEGASTVGDNDRSQHSKAEDNACCRRRPV